jgi:hypothetical protein
MSRSAIPLTERNYLCVGKITEYGSAVAAIQMEPTRRTVGAIMRPRRAAHLAR